MKKNFLSGLLLATMLGSATFAWAAKYTYSYTCNGEVVAYYESEGESSEFIKGGAPVWGTGKFKGHKYFIDGTATKGPNFKITVVESHYSLTWLGEQFDGGDLLYEAKILYDKKIEDDLSNIQDTIVFNLYRKKDDKLYRFAQNLSNPLFAGIISRSELYCDKSPDGNYKYDDLPKVLFKDEIDEDKDGVIFQDILPIEYSSINESKQSYNDLVLFYGEGEDSKYGGTRFVWDGYYFGGKRIKTRGNSFSKKYSGGYAGIIKDNGKYELGSYPAGSYRIKIRKYAIPNADEAEREKEKIYKGFRNLGYPKDFQSYRQKPLDICSSKSGKDTVLVSIAGSNDADEHFSVVTLDSPADLYLKGDNIPFDYVVVEKNTEDVHVNDYGYATYSSSNALDFHLCASEVDVFKATLVETTAIEQKNTGFSRKVKFVNVTDKLIPANTGILVRSKSQKAVTVKANIIDGQVSNFTDNFLMPVVESKYVKSEEDDGRVKYRNFVLNKQNVEDEDSNIVSRVNFYRIPKNWGVMECRAHSAYLRMPRDYTNLQAKSINIVFDDEDVTDIDKVFESGSTFDKADNDNMYNLAGQRVDSSYKGIIIRNGRKYLNK